MSEDTKIDPKHLGTGRVLRTLGPILAGIGLLLVVIGMVSLFSWFGSSPNLHQNIENQPGSFEPPHMELPHYVWCVFVGGPVFFVGLAMCQYGFLGAFFRYFSAEAAPVTKDVFNYMAEGTKEGVKTIATAVGEGLSAGMNPKTQVGVYCPRCNHTNDADAKFCKNCATALAR